MFKVNRFTTTKFTFNKSIFHNLNNAYQKWHNHFLFQAVIGIAFSIGFIIGPLIGAMFAMKIEQTAEPFFVTPAILAFSLAVLEIALVYQFFEETLPTQKKVLYLCVLF